MPMDFAKRVAYLRTCPYWKTFFASTIKKKGVSESMIPIVCFTRVDLPLPTGPVIPTAEGLGNPPPRSSSRTLIPVGSIAVTIERHRFQQVKRIVPRVRLGLSTRHSTLRYTLISETQDKGLF